MFNSPTIVAKGKLIVACLLVCGKASHEVPIRIIYSVHYFKFASSHNAHIIGAVNEHRSIASNIAVSKEASVLATDTPM